MTARLRLRHLQSVLLAVVTGLYVSGAVAQWAWKEEGGRVVYSDRPPPADVKIQILRQPANSTPIAPAQSGSAGKEGAASAPKSIAERDMEFRKRQQERADSERKEQEEQQRTAAKAESCERARGYLRTLEDGVRIVRTDAQGNREYLDDAQRATEMAKARKIVDQTCN